MAEAEERRVAKLLLKSKPELAKQRLQEIVADHPGTAAALEAARLLREIDD